METKSADTVLVHWLQYSKRIAIAGIAQWCVAAVIVQAYAGLAMFTNTVLDVYVVDILKNVVGSASTLAVSTSSAYYLHSAAEKYIDKTALSAHQEPTAKG